MNSVQRVKRLCKEKKIPIYKIEKDLGYANGYIGQLKKGVFPDDRLKEIANYLNVSTFYLIYGEEEILAKSIDLYEVIANLCKERNIAITALEKELGFSNGSIGRLKKGGSMTFRRLQKVADYFGVSVDTFTNPENTRPQSVDLNDEINRLLYALTSEQSAYFSGDLVSEEGKLALINSLKQDLEFLKATTVQNDKKDRG